MATNPQLKKAHAEDEYTPEMVQELVKCSKDPIYFIKKYCKVQHPTKGTVPFDLFEYQERMIRHISSNRKNIILCSRQLGKCLFGNTAITTIKKPKGLKRVILYLIDKPTYQNLFE